MLDHLARCRAVCFPPLDEDYGFVTVEAFASRKAVITCVDSGGPAELVRDGETGLVCDPTPAAMAAAIARLMDDAGVGRAARQRGRRACRRADVAGRGEAIGDRLSDARAANVELANRSLSH